ncbi:sigma-54 interaction domain-containing protein [Clostridium sp.]|uniref:sigma-54 interaction domain-containing protein n=1 Tax=Clostridium sp. TaxID=1506 RepID=UPI002FC5F15F
MKDLNLNYYKSIINTLDDAVLTISKDLDLVYVNTKASSLLLKETSFEEFDILKSFPKLKSIFLPQPINSHIDTISLTINNINFECDINKLMLDDLDFVGYIIILKETKKLIKVANKLISSDAPYTFDNLVGNSPQLNEVINIARIISKSPSTVLITGESGCGKELMAQSIHNASSRLNEPFIALNCGAIPKSLIESELFGYDEGAFTGAKKGGKIGKFELASGGTLFLDEIGEMPLEMQVHLLRVLQEGVITKVGGKNPIKIDVRIIAATNKDLKEEIKNGKFRSDLYYRLNVIPLHIPPLKDRFGDVPILIDHFLKIKSEKLNKPIPNISDRLFKKMISYCWPGNIRELENCIENIVNLNGETSYEMNFDECICLKYDNLGNIIEHFCDDGSCLICNPITPSVENELPLTTLLELEQHAIKQAITHFNGNMTKAATSLGISRNALYNKIKRYNINK